MLFSYSFYLSSLFVCVFFAYWGSKYDLKPLLYLLILFLACITGFRGYEVGIDTTNYIKIWDNMLVGTPVYIELGFQWLICYLQKITANPTILFFICSLITYSCFVLRLWDFKNIASFPLMIAILFMLVLMPSMNVMRQYCAIAIIFYSTRFLFWKKYTKYIVGIVLASLLHYSALIAISFWGFELLEWKNLPLLKRRVYLILIVVLLFFVQMIYFFVMTEYGHYFEDKEEKLGILTLAKIFFIITSAFLSGIWRKKILSGNDKFIIKISFWMYLLGVLIESLGYFFPYMRRIGLPFSIFAVLYWGILFRNTKNMTLNFVYFIALFLFVGLPFLLSMVDNGFGTMPYSFFIKI